ncbi:ABC transporter substrate-binding protein [Mesorhizobium sp. M1E.F.Ca.ET.045.02.1.1]|uniref:ABC transporter substrate-binding protein n=1 Tax=Mesorhizobium sp. M1E.F.Ca.ET.045.02.1.1 TaxID=2493672 RepID=UPI000F75D94F|nr:ABC transporter substrate-binding protein [Mesorhizobium sp. M1E.F.Ca.ET.045.02.1.1]AZO22629.1 ABC transporter substrate-binding protein [Mesorhizobium sp. M1E.F.Ca.ET.045.02.1.1]
MKYIPSKLAIRLAVAALSLTPAYAQQKLTISASGGSYDACVKQVYSDSFEKENGIKVVVGSPAYDTGVWRAQQESGKVEWDVATSDPGQLQQLVENGWVLPLDPKLLQSKGGLVDFPGMVTTKDNKVYALPSEIFSIVVTYNSDAFPGEKPRTWSDVFDVKRFPGKRLFSNSVVDFGVLEVALLADGVEPSKLYPLDVERALKKLDTIKSDIAWYDFGTQQIALLQQGEAVIGAGWDGRVKALQKEGVHVDFSPDQAIVKPDLWVLPKGANAEAGARFLRHIHDPQRQADFAKCIGYAPALKGAYSLLGTGQKFTIDPQDLSKVVPWGANYWAEHARDVTTRFNEWLTQ